jgi:hypothetical protein
VRSYTRSLHHAPKELMWKWLQSESTLRPHRLDGDINHPLSVILNRGMRTSAPQQSLHRTMNLR